MAKTRRDLRDYDADSWRFEEWLSTAYGETVSQLVDIDSLIERLEEWLSSIDVRGSTQGRFAKSLLSNLLSRNLIAVNRPKEVEIIRDFLIDRTGRKWLKTEEQHLARMYSNPKVARKVSVPYIARELGRTPNAIYAKAKKLGLKRPPDAMTETKLRKMQRPQP